MERTRFFMIPAFAILISSIPAVAQKSPGSPAVLSIRERAALTLQITQKRLDVLVPKMMRETGFDMWIIIGNEDNHDPIFETMMPYENWNPITQIIVFFDRDPEKGVERLNVSRTDTQGLFKNVWDAAAWDTQKKESQWDCLGRIVRERDPKRIGINEGEVQWAAGGLTVVLKKRLVEAIGPKYASRLQSAEPLSTLWAECNRLQDVFCGEFKTGLAGNEMLANILKKAKELGIPGPRVYSHSLGYFLHEPGPLIGLPWEQVNNPGRGDVKLVPNSCFTVELSVTAPTPEWGEGKEFRLPLEQAVAFTEDGIFFLDGRQTKFHLIR
ncbi:MAG: hypothetical protein WBC70_14440 [Candidatus Aminicenantales bacterium]